MKKLLAALLLLAPTCLFSTTTMTGNIKDLTGTAQTGSFVRFWLRGCNGNQPRIAGVGVIAPSQGGVFYFDAVPNGSGAISKVLYATTGSGGTGDGEIECGGSKQAVWYGMQVYNNGKPGPEVPIQAPNTGTVDISTVTPITSTPVSAATTSFLASTNIFTQPQSDAQGTVTNSTVSNPMFSVSRTDNSAPTSGAGILNSWYAPMTRLDLTTQSGNVTGSHGVLLLNMPSVKGKSTTTITSSVTGSGSPQTVPVADSSVFSVNDVATVDLNQGSGKTEGVTITAIPDGTHVTGVFINNHASGALIAVSGKGDKINLGVVANDQAGNTNNVFGINTNVISKSVTPGHQVLGTEIDVTNSTGIAPGAFLGDMTNGPFLLGMSFINAGANDASAALYTGTSNAATRFLNGFLISGTKNNGIAIINDGGGAPTNGISIQTAGTNGIIIGSNQTAAANPNIALSDPTNGIYLTARTVSEGTTNATSNRIRLESIKTSVTHTFDIQHVENSGGLYFLHDGASIGPTTAPFVNLDGSFETFNALRLRGSGGSVNADLKISGTAATLSPENGGTLTVNATTYTTASNCSSSGGTCGSAAAGRVSIAAAATTVTVATTAVTANSEIFIQEDSTLGTALSVTCNTTTGRTYTVTTRTAGTSFVITSNASPSTNPACLSYRIVN